MVNYYRTLGVDSKASDADIRQAYRRLARKYHPDVNPRDKKAEARFKEINEAYEILSDPETRRKHDQNCDDWGHDDHLKAQKTKQWTCGPVDVILDLRVGFLDDAQSS